MSETIHEGDGASEVPGLFAALGWPLGLGLYGLLALPAAVLPGPLLQFVSDQVGWLAAAVLMLALGGLGGMLHDILTRRAQRVIVPISILVSAAIHAVLHVRVFGQTLAADEFLIFEPLYIAGVAFVAPALVGALPWLVPGVRRSLRRSGLVGFAAWSMALGLAHLTLIAAASASV